MRNKLNDVPALKALPTVISAERYNRVRLGLLRIANPLRMSLPGLRSLALQLENDAWVCVDSSLEDLPIIAWTGFQTTHRGSLHEAVPCQLHFYHSHASMIMGTVLDLMDMQLRELLSHRPVAESKVVYLIPR